MRRCCSCRPPPPDLANLRANKLRSFLTMFGIIWGVISIVRAVGGGRGVRARQPEGARGAGQEHRHHPERPDVDAGRRRARRAGRPARPSTTCRRCRRESKLLEHISPELDAGRAPREERVQRQLGPGERHLADLPVHADDRGGPRPARSARRTAARRGASSSSASTRRSSCSPIAIRWAPRSRSTACPTP